SGAIPVPATERPGAALWVTAWGQARGAMATAATTNRGSNGPYNPGTPDGGRNSGRRGGGRSQSGGGSGAQRSAPVRAQAAIYPRPGRIGRLQVIRLVFLEAAAALVAVPLLTKHTFWVALTLPIAALCVVGALAGSHGRWLGQMSLVRGEYRERRSQNVDASGGEAALAPLRETFPGLRTVTISSRSGEPVGMIGDGTFLTAVIRVGSRTEPLRAPRTAQPLPLGAIAGVLADDKLSASCVQIVTYTQPAPAPHLPPHALAVRSYQEVMGDVPGQRTTWVAVRLDPQEAMGAIEARGGGAVGTQRTLLTAVQRVASDLEGAGFEAVPLSEPELITALGTACGDQLRLAQRYCLETGALQVTGHPLHRGQQRALGADGAAAARLDRAHRLLRIQPHRDPCRALPRNVAHHFLIRAHRERVRRQMRSRRRLRVRDDLNAGG